MMTMIRSTVLPLALLMSGYAATPTDSAGGIGVLGDSYSDEYQFYPPDRSTARNWVEILATTRGLDFGRFDAVGRGEPRNQGHAFNWSRSGATTEDLIRTGQHTGLAAQVASGEVGLVVIFVGGNDFINALSGSDPAAALGVALPRALENHRTAVRTIIAASPRAKLVLITLPDIRHLPEFDGALRAGRLAPALADAFTAAIGRYNAQIRSLAASAPRIALMDLDVTTRGVNLLGRDYVLVAGRRLDRHRPANDLDCLFLADGRHPGTLGQGLFACMFIETINTKFAVGISPLEPRELLAVARSVAPRRDTNIGVVGPTGAPRPKTSVKPAVGHTGELVSPKRHDVRGGAGRSDTSSP